MALRLTLRTLLAYLDDTLQAAEIKDIGQKVSESDAAQELIARIKQVTRRRRLTVPSASGPHGMDPNDVAEYLDNVLSAEQVGEIEKHALESDVHLAEIAASHQILTLVLGEPALVPPKARERMYALTQIREAPPPKKAQPAPAPAAVAHGDDEHALSLSGGPMRWILPLAGVLLVTALGLAVYQILPQRDHGTSVVARRTKVRDEEPKEKAKEKEKEKDVSASSPVLQPPAAKEPAEKGLLVKNPAEKEPAPTEKVNPAEVERSKPPLTTRVGLGKFAGTVAGLPLGVVTRTDDKGDWKLAKAGEGLFSRDTYVALPGFAGVLRTRSGVGILPRGHLRDFTKTMVERYLMDSAIVLHENKDFDLDLTLLRGRVFLTNQKASGPAKIRLRFDREVWDVTLADKGGEIVVDLIRFFTPQIDYRTGEGPRVQCYLGVLRGEAELKIDAYDTYNVEAVGRKWVRMEWDSFAGRTGPIKEDSPPPSKQPPSLDTVPEAVRPNFRKMMAALKDIEALFTTRESPSVAVQETLDKNDPASRLLAVYCLPGLEEIGRLIDTLNDEDRAHAPDREAAYYALQTWISRGPKQSKILYDESAKTATGLLIDKMYKKREAERFVKLLHPILAEDKDKVVTYQDLAAELDYPKVALAEMAFWQLVSLAQGVRLPAGFNAAAPQEERERYAGEILKMIDKKILPPPPPAEKPAAPQVEKQEKDKEKE